MALILLGLIVLPSGLLGYFSWRAIESEKLLAHERLAESYGQVARLAAREIDEALETLENDWASAIQRMLTHAVEPPSAAHIAQFLAQEPLISAVFVLSEAGKIAYPTGLRIQEESASSQLRTQEAYLHEHDRFNTLVTRGEELEYRTYDLDGAIATYRTIMAEVTSLQLRGMAQSYMGRALMKQGQWQAAFTTFRQLLAEYPEVRDLNDMYLRFVAQYQMAVCLENLGRDHEAVEMLLGLYRDLLERSDAIHTTQYEFFLDQIRQLMPRLLASPQLSNVQSLQTDFQQLTLQTKKHISARYFLELLDRRLTKLVIARRSYRPKLRYASGEAEDEPYLLVYRSLPDPSGVYTAGLVALQIDLTQLRQQLFPTILRGLRANDDVTLAILDKKGAHVIGTAQPTHQPIAVHSLATPFSFWQVGVYLPLRQTAPRQWDVYTAVWLWLITMLILSIVWGAFLFIRRAQREAHLSRLKSTFVSSVSHELRTPLASIKMFAELLEMQLVGRATDPSEPPSSRVREHLGVIRRECDRLVRLIENVLDFSKIERGVKQYRFEYEEPAAVLRGAIDMFRPYAEAQGFRLAVDLAEALPEVRLDADALVQAMLNVLSNAVKYSPEVKDIGVRAYRDGAYVVVDVSDRGVGLAASEIPKIFEHFYRVDQRLNASSQGGMGLGLTLVRHIIEAHGGEVRVRSEVGKGSTFSLTLPIPVEAVDPHDELSPMRDAGTEPVRTHSSAETTL